MRPAPPFSRDLGFLALPEHEIPDVNEYSDSLAENEDGIPSVYGIDEEHAAADEREIPENLWNGAPFLFFGNDPLHEESRAENPLSDKSEDDP